MPQTNTFTAQTATIAQPQLSRPLSLIGIFDGPHGARVLLRTRSGAIEPLAMDAPSLGRRLLSIGPGWALVDENGTLHRLTIV